MSDSETGFAAVSAEPELVELAPAVTAVVRGVVPLAGLRDFYDESFRVLPATISAQGAAIVGPAFALYRGPWGESVDLEAGFFTGRPVTPEGKVEPGSLPGGRAGRLTHVGSFDGLGDSWARLESWLRGLGLAPAAERWEVYVTQPTPDMDPARLRTDLHWPVA
jgi:effector-binding domain-containing protein